MTPHEHRCAARFYADKLFLSIRSPLPWSSHPVEPEVHASEPVVPFIDLIYNYQLPQAPAALVAITDPAYFTEEAVLGRLAQHELTVSLAYQNMSDEEFFAQLI